MSERYQIDPKSLGIDDELINSLEAYEGTIDGLNRH